MCCLPLARYHSRERHFTTGEPSRPGPGVTMIVSVFDESKSISEWVETNYFLDSLV